MGKTLRATHRARRAVTVVRSLDERDEADFVVEEIDDAPSRGRRRCGCDDVRGALSHERAEPRARGSAAEARHAVPTRRRGALLRPPRDPRSHGVSQAHRQSVRRRGVPPRGRRSETRARRDDDRAARRGVACSAGVPMLEGAQRRPTSLGAASRGAHRARRVRAIDPVASRARARKRRSTSCCRSSSTRFATATTCAPKARSRAERIDNVRELIDGAAETGRRRAGRSRTSPLDHFLQRARLVAGAPTRWARRRRDHAHDDAQREGPRVSRGVHHRSRGRTVPAREGVRRSRRCSRKSDACSTSASRAPSESCTSRSPRSAGATASSCRRSRRASSTSIPETLVEKRSTIKVRSSGRSMMRAGGDSSYGNAVRTRRRAAVRDVEDLRRVRRRRLGGPASPVVDLRRSAPEDESQDAPRSRSARA